MSDQPSWKTSTLSQAFLGSLIFYAVILLMVTGGLIWVKLDVEVAKLVVGWGSALEASLASAYLTARKSGNSNSLPPPPTPP